MILTVINSNSKGNSYILENEHTALLIECGVKFDQINQAIDFKLTKIKACLTSHEHKDHSKSLDQVQQAGIPVIATKGTFEALNVHETLQDIVIKHGEFKTVDGWKVSAFTVEHDAKEPVGFIIEHEDCGRVLFITDTYRLKWNFPFEFDHIIIEANYCEELADKMKEMKGEGIVETRRLRNHMSLQTAMQTVEKLNTKSCRNIVLIHLSDGLTDAKRFAIDMEKATGIRTIVADAGTKVNFKLNPY